MQKDKVSSINLITPPPRKFRLTSPLLLGVIALFALALVTCVDPAGGGGNVAWTAVKNTTFGTGETSGIAAIAYGNNRFVAVGASGKIAYSTTGY